MAKSKFTPEERKARRRAYVAKWARDRRASDPEFREVHNAKQRKKRQNPDVTAAERAQAKVRYATRQARAKVLFKAAKTRAGYRKEPFTLTLDHVRAGLDCGVCPRTGYWFDFTAGSGINPRSPSLDRIDPNGPYSDVNIQVVCWQYNVMKQRLTDAELLEFCKAVTEAAK